MSAFSAIDLQTRLEVQDLLSRFCHALDHNAVDRWAKLFTTDGYIDAPRLGCFKGREEIIKIPEMVHELGGGAWRHYLNNVYIERAEDNRDLKVEAYCMSATGGKPAMWFVVGISVLSLGSATALNLSASF